MTERKIRHASLIAIHNDLLLPGEQGQPQDLHTDTLPATADRRIPLSDDTYVIGRSSRDCNIRVSRHRLDISRKHASIVRSGAEYLLQDHSTLGTFINGQRVAGVAALHSGDVIGFANSREMLVFKLEGALDVPQVDQLTERERVILHLLALGQSNKEIATALNITANTVKAHLKSIFDKLDVENRTEAAAAARRRGLL